MMKISCRIPCLALGASMLVATAVALPVSSLTAQEQPAVDIKKLIADLNNDSFDVRRAAKDKLVKLGRQAVPALAATAQDKSSDTSYSAVRVLSRIAQQAKGADARAAEDALKKVAKGDDVIARQAREALEEMQQAARQPQRRMRGLQNFPFPGGQVEVRGGNGNFRSSQTSVVNGVVNTTVSEPGRKVQIMRDPNGPVSVTVSDDGKEPKTWKAKTAEELKSKHPDAHKLLEKYSSNMRRITIPNMDDIFEMDMDDFRQMQGMMFPPGMNRLGAMDPFAPMGRDPFPQFRRRQAAPSVAREVKDAKLLAKDLAELVGTMKKKSSAPELQRMQEKLEALQRNLDRIKRQTER